MSYKGIISSSLAPDDASHFITSTRYQLLTLGKKQFKKPKESDAEAAKHRGKRVKKVRKRELERQEIKGAKKRKKLTPTASSSSSDTNRNEPSCGTSCDGGEETDKIFQAAKSTSTDDIEIRPEGTKKTETQTEESDYMFSRFVYRAPDKAFLILLRKYTFTMVYHPMKSLM